MPRRAPRTRDSGDDSHAFRYGAPAAVVDPLVSLLYDLRRMEDTVISALVHLGVERHRLPGPFRPSESSTAAATAPVAAPSPPPPQRAQHGEERDALLAYAQSLPAECCTAGGNAERCAVVVRRLLAWVGQQAAPESPTPPASQALLASFVAASAAGSEDAFLRDCGTQAETHVARAAKRARTEDATAAGDGAPASVTTHVASLTAGDVAAAAEEWRVYERFLKSGTREMEATLAAVTARRLGDSYSCHAKWVEGTRRDVKVRCTVPASAVLKRNYEEVIRLNDALATCQVAVHDAYVALEANLDVYLDEVRTVDQQERLFHDHVAAARRECAALQSLRLHVKDARAAMQRALDAAPDAA